jgi:solute carrier family 13 (sodium-dependent dicarboxylate transporter), member 2/3/5
MSEAAAAGEPVEEGLGRNGRRIGLALGPLLVVALQLVGAPEGLSREAWITVSVLALMVTWWVTDAIPMAATALIPLVAFPLFGVAPAADTARPYADPILFLFIGGFMIAVAIERWGLHARIALQIASRVGARPAALIGGFLLASVLISLWISNTATTLMLTPIAVGVVRAMGENGYEDGAFAAGLVLAVAYGASIGGMGTPVGSPTNVIAMGFLEERGIALSFAQWMTLGVPVILLTAPALFWLTTRGLRRATAEDAARGRQVLHDALAALGPMSRAEGRVLAVFLLVALAWMTRELLTNVPGLERLSDMGIAVAGALALFLLPSADPKGATPRLLDWKTAERIPWGIVLLFGGGLSVAGAMESTGLSDWLAGELAPLRGLAPLVVIAALLLVTLVTTELMSNVASLTAMLPIVAALAEALQISPLLLVFPVSIAASLGFMLPIATAPNAIAYATGFPSLRRMLLIGFALNLAGIAAILLVNAVLAPAVLAG